MHRIERFYDGFDADRSLAELVSGTDRAGYSAKGS